MKYLIYFFFLISSSCYSAVLGTDGKIQFDANFDSQPEMTLNSTGLGISALPSTNLHVAGNAIISNQLFVGASSGASNLNVNGTFGFGSQVINSNTTLGHYSNVFVDSSSGNISLTLPYAGNVSGRVYTIKKTSGLNSVWISGGGNLIDDTTPIVLANSSSVLPSVTLISNGRSWLVINSMSMTSSSTVASSNLVAWYKLDETSGNTVSDASGAGNSGGITGASYRSVSGIFNKAVELNWNYGGSYINITDISLVGELTLCSWIKANAMSNCGVFGMVGSGGSGGGKVVLDGANIYTRFFGTLDISTNSTVNNTWNLLVWVRNSNNKVDLYVNGGSPTRLFGDVAQSGTLQVSTIGAMEDGAQIWVGSLDDIRIYNRALTASEIQALYQR